jgi:hypothetical protein
MIENMTIIRRLAPALIALWMAACASSSHVIVGTPRPPIPPDQVKVYSTPPPAFEEVAILSASSDSMLTVGGQHSLDKVVERLKEQAAKLGANGVILEGLADSQTGSIGAGGGSDSYSRNSSVGVGVGGSLGIFKKTGKGRAIYVPAS